MDNSKGDSYFISIDEDQLPGITVGVYKAFLKRGKDGIEALAVYQHLLFTYRLQHTNQIWATDEYIAKGIHIGLVVYDNSPDIPCGPGEPLVSVSSWRLQTREIHSEA